MTKKPFLSDQDIIHNLKTAYGVEVAKLIFLPIGADMNAQLYKAEARDRSSYFIKIKRGSHSDLSVAIMELLQDADVQPIIPPIKTIQDSPTQRIEDVNLIVYPFVEGQNGFNRDLTDDQWVKLGKALRQVHDIEVPLSIQEKIRREVYSSKWRETVQSFYIHIETKLFGDEIAQNLLKFMQENIQSIRRLVDRAEQLAQKIQEQSPKFVLCHSDIHGGNVLIAKNNTIYMVDWDDPIMAPKERDLMFIGGGIANVWNKLQEEAFFYKGYGKIKVNRTILSYYRHERIVEDIALYGQTLLLTTDGGEDRSVMYQQFIDMFKSNGVVDIAFKTDENPVI